MRLRTLIGRNELDVRTDEMGREIAEKYAGMRLNVLCVAKGAIFFCVDLMRAIERAKLGVRMRLDLIQLSSMQGTRSTGVVEFLFKPRLDLVGEHVLIVEDIIDSGLSMREIHRALQAYRARTIETAVLLDKREARRPEFPFIAEYTGFVIPRKFVIGDGLDYNEDFRELNDIEEFLEDEPEAASI